MAFQRKKVAAALAYAVSVGTTATLLTSVPAYAQDMRVNVTGTSIKRVESETGSPVQVMTREEIERTGATSVQDLLQFITAATSSGNFNASTVIGASTFGLQTASLRGLGGARTLVLLNGRRLGGFAGDQLNGQAVNLTSIPFSAIERVEVLKDSASAIYGTDAIAGVINFILKKDYKGAEVNLYYGAPTRSPRSDGTVTDVSATAGWGDLSKDRYNVFLNGAWHKEKALYQKDRDFSNTSLIEGVGLYGVSSNMFPANITAPAGYPSIGTLNPAAPSGCGGYPGSIPGPEWALGPNTRCVWDPAAVAQSYPEVETISFYGKGTFQINKDWQAFVSGAYSTSENHNIIQPTPISDIFNDPIILQPSSPYYPTAYLTEYAPSHVGNPINVRYRAVLNGNRDITDKNEAWQIVGGVEGSWKNWDINVAGFYNETEVKETLNGGFPQLSLLVPLLNTGLVNFFGETPADVASPGQGDQLQRPGVQGRDEDVRLRRQDVGRRVHAAGGPARGRGRHRVPPRGDHQQPERGAANGRHLRVRRQLRGHRQEPQRLGALRRGADPDRQDRRPEPRRPVRRLQRHRQHDQPEGHDPLAAEQPVPRPRVVQHGLPRAVAAAALPVAADGCHRAGHGRPGPLPGDERQPRLRYAVQRALRRQPGPQARGVGVVDAGLRVRAGAGGLVRRRLLQHQGEGPDHRRGSYRPDPWCPTSGPELATRAARPGRSQLPDAASARSRRSSQTNIGEPGRGEDRRRRPRDAPAVAADRRRALQLRRVGHVLHQVRHAEHGRQLHGRRLDRVPARR